MQSEKQWGKDGLAEGHYILLFALLSTTDDVML